MLRKGFDGLFLDNTDTVETHPLQVAGMRTLVRGLSMQVHSRRELLFAQNGEDSIGPTLRYYDGWNREDVTSTYDFSRHQYVVQPADERASAAAALRRISGAGLLVLATDYTAAGDAAGAALAARSPTSSHAGKKRGFCRLRWRTSASGAALPRAEHRSRSPSHSRQESCQNRPALVEWQ